MAQYRIEIDRSLCSGFGSCVDTAPEVFAMGGDGMAVLRDGDADGRVLEAAQGCPMGALSVFDPATGEQLV